MTAGRGRGRCMVSPCRAPANEFWDMEQLWLLTQLKVWLAQVSWASLYMNRVKKESYFCRKKNLKFIIVITFIHLCKIYLLIPHTIYQKVYKCLSIQQQLTRLLFSENEKWQVTWHMLCSDWDMCCNGGKDKACESSRGTLGDVT